MAGSVMREWQGQVVSRQAAAVWGIVSLLVAFVGPFSTFASMSFALRLLYWGGLIGLSIPASSLCRILMRRWLPTLPLFSADMLACCLFAILFAPVVYAATYWLSLRNHVQMVPFWMMALAVLLAACIVTVVRTVMIPRAVQAEVGLMQAAPVAAQPVAGQPRLLDRLDADRRGPVLHLSVEDHYVIVHTERGPSKLLMRFADAIQELDGVAGMQVHRSHWVARAAVAETVRAGGQVHLRLVNGTLVPVSRTFREDVLAAV